MEDRREKRRKMISKRGGRREGGREKKGEQGKSKKTERMVQVELHM